MESVAQLVEHRVVASVAVGSSPITLPTTVKNLVLDGAEAIRLQLRRVHKKLFQKDYAPVAQLDRAPDFESVGRRFESCRAYHQSDMKP